MNSFAWNSHCLNCGKAFDVEAKNFVCPACGPGDWSAITALDRLTSYSEYELMRRYDRELDDCSPEISIGNQSHSVSQLFKGSDPLAYRTGFAEFVAEWFAPHPYLKGRYYWRSQFDEAVSEESETV